ncbi:MAG: glycosyltransferase family 39 protein [Elusimicrobiota bacterium]
MTRRRVLLLSAAAVLFWICRRAYYVGYFNDDAFYMIGARSLLLGRYAQLQAPGWPALTTYLPGWPMLLSPIVALAGGRLEVLQAYAVVLHVAALGLFASMIDREDGPQVADLTLAALLASPLIASTAGTLLSDGPMMLCAAAAVAAVSRCWGRRDAGIWISIGVLGGLAALIRPNGLALAAAIALLLVRERRGKETALLAGTTLAIFALWLWRCALVSGLAWNYWSEMSSSIRAAGLSAAGNAGYYARDIFFRALWRLPGLGPGGEGLVAFLGTGLCVSGLLRARTTAGRCAALFAALFLAPLIFWPKLAGRYAIPILPIALWGACRGLALIHRRAAILIVGLGAVLSAVATAGVVKASRDPIQGANAPPSRAAAHLRASSSAGSVLAAEYDGRWHILSGIAGVHVPYDVRTPESFAAFLREARVRLVLVEDTSSALRPLGGAYAVPQADDLRELVKSLPGARVEWSDAQERVEIWRVSE